MKLHSFLFDLFNGMAGFLLEYNYSWHFKNMSFINTFCPLRYEIQLKSCKLIILTKKILYLPMRRNRMQQYVFETK